MEVTQPVTEGNLQTQISNEETQQTAQLTEDSTQTKLMEEVITEDIKTLQVSTEHPLDTQTIAVEPKQLLKDDTQAPQPTTQATHKVEELTNQLPMDLEHESCMKQQLLRHAVQQEADMFMRDPDCIHDLIYLDYIFTQMRSFPLLSSKEKAKEKLEEFIRTLPQFLNVSQRASKLDQQNKQLRVLVAGTFQINFKTPLERNEMRKMLEENYSRKVAEEKDGAEPEKPEDRMRRANFDKGQHELVVVAERMFLDMSQEGGVARFFEVVKSTPKFAIHFEIRYISRFLAKDRQNDGSELREKLFRQKSSVQAQAFIQANANAGHQGNSRNHKSSKPMGMQSLLQNMTAASTELKRSEKLLKTAKQNALTLLKRLGPKVGSKVLEQIPKYLLTHELPMPEEEHFKTNERGFKEVSYESLYNFEFVFDAVGGEVDVTKLERPDIEALQQVIVHEVRVQEKRDLVSIYIIYDMRFSYFPSTNQDLLGTEKMVSMIKELWTIFDEPIALLCRSNLGSHMERMLKGVKEIVKVSEASKELSIEERLEAYNVVLQRVQDDFYALCHDIAKRDTGAFQKTFQWYINIMKCVTGDPLDVQALIKDLPEGEQAQIIAEVNAMAEYQELVQKGQKPPRRPHDPMLRKLVPMFNEMVRSRLPPKTAVVPKKG